ncbi:hypothetical protein AB0J90_07150 [Micromonospora sp. NPDC049523]|uniref:hypothetical protein n=1 Tax=Micromonospora sp. NPDC049523 TaxID=3155921 RepID=UPI0034148C58
MSKRALFWVGALVACLTVTTGIAIVLRPQADPRSAAAPASDPPSTVPPTAPSGGLPATVTVAAGTELGALDNPARYQNQSGPSQTLTPLDEKRIAQLEPVVLRGWFKPESYYDHLTDSYDFDYPTPGGGKRFYAYADQLDRLSEQIFANFDQCDPELMTPNDPGRCRAVLKAGIRHYKERYPSLRYIELFNEPDKTWEPSPVERAPISAADYYTWYKVGYSIVNELNEELAPAVPLRIGGPAAYTFDSPFLKEFLDRFRADSEPTKRLDFLSYHQYRRRDDPASAQTEKKTAQQWLSERDLDPATPVYVTEYGVFPGANTGTTFEEDLLTQAAAMSTLGYYYVAGGTDMVMHWVFDHGENDRKSLLVDGADGKVNPYYNLVAMQRKLKSQRIKATAGPLSPKGIGVNALATRDRTGIAILATNYQWTDGTAQYLVDLRVDDLPSEYTKGNILVERYLVDATTSNYAYDPTRSDLQRVERYTIPATSSLTATFHLGRNAMSLVVVTPF